jgi:hypothetical protein
MLDEPRQDILHAPVVDVLVGLLDGWVALRMPLLILLNFSLQIDARITQRAHDDIGADALRARNVAHRIVERNICGAVLRAVGFDLLRAEQEVERIRNTVGV